MAATAISLVNGRPVPPSLSLPDTVDFGDVIDAESTGQASVAVSVRDYKGKQLQQAIHRVEVGTFRIS